MGVFDKFKGAGSGAKNAFSNAEAKFDSFLDKTAEKTKQARSKNKNRKEKINTILGRDDKPEKGLKLGSSQSPFRSQPSGPSFALGSAPSYSTRNVIYGEKENPKRKKRSVRIQFED